MRNIILILMLGVIFSGFIQAEEVIQSTVTAKKELKLQWKKTFDGEIKNFVPSENGNYIAVSVDKSELKDKFSGINFLDREGNVIWQKNLKYDWKIRGIVDKSTAVIVIPKGPQRAVKIYNKEGQLDWDSEAKENRPGLPIISPSDKYIMIVHNGIEGVTPQGIKVYDIEGNELWRYKPEYFFNADFLSDNEIILVSVEQYGIAQRNDNNKGYVEIREAETGEIKYEEKIDIPFEVPDIDYIDYHPDENSAEIIFGDKKLLFDLKGKIDIDKIVSKVKSQWSNGWQIETDASVIEINKANQKELLFYQKTE